MPQLNPDEAANDERKIFNDESVGEDEVGGWQDSELNDIKDDLVDEDDVEPVRPSYDVSRPTSATASFFIPNVSVIFDTLKF